MDKPLKVVALSDIHLGHRTTKAEDTIAGLNKSIPDNISSQEIDIIFLAGDIFDEALMHNDEDVHLIQLWMSNLLRICKKYDIVLRVLEGTPSHDRNQSKHFVTLNEIGKFGVDLEYVNVLSIRSIGKFGLQILYIPDEWGSGTDDNWKEVNKLLQKHGLEKVDFCIMHGMFEYQLPKHLDFPHHISERYLSITKHYIFIGHVHTPSKFKRILVPGSFDRCCQGEEENKGHWEVTVYPDERVDEIKHVTNHLATIYKRIDCRGLELTEALKSLEFVSELRENSSIEIYCHRGSDISTSIDTLRALYPGIRFKYKIEKDESETVGDLDLGDKYQAIELTKSNLQSLLIERIQLSNSDPTVLSKASSLLETML